MAGGRKKGSSRTRGVDARPNTNRSSRRIASKRPRIPKEDTHAKTKLCRAFATFISESAAAIEEPFTYLISGDHQKSLFYHTMLPIKIFSAMLIGCNLISTRTMKDNIIQVQSSQETWADFLNRYQLDNEYEMVADVQIGQINLDALPNYKVTAEEDDIEETGRKKRKDMLAICIGKQEKGVSYIATKTINDGIPPPSFSPKLRTAQRRLFNAIAPELSQFIFHDNISAIEDWVRMDDTSGGEGKPKDIGIQDPGPPTTTSKGTTSKPGQPTITPSPGTGQLKTSGLEDSDFVSPVSSLRDGSRSGNLLSFLGSAGMDDPNQKATMTPRAIELIRELQKELGINTEKSPRSEQNSPSELVSYSIPLPGVPASTSKLKSTASKKYSMIEQLGIDVMSRTNDGYDRGKMNSQNLLRQLVSFMNSKGESIKYETENSVYEHEYLKVTTRKKDGVMPDVSDVCDSLFEMGNPRQLVGTLMEYLLDNHKEATLEHLREHRLIPKVMNEYQIAASMDYAGIYSSHWKKIVHCLKTFQDTAGLQFAPEDKIRKLGGAHVKITTDVIHYEKTIGNVKECIKFWYKDPTEEFVNSVETIVNGKRIDPKNIEWINHCAGGDHADVKFRFLAKTIVKTKDGQYHVDIYSLADVGCKKDSGDILYKTVLNQMIEGMNSIGNGKLIFNEILHEDSNRVVSEYSVDLVEAVDEERSSGTVINPTSFLTGDLAFLAVVLGKEGFAGWWCCFCKGFRPDWQEKGRTFDLWDMKGLREQALMNEEEELGGADRMGVKLPTQLDDSVLVVFPGLHALLGIGNQLINYLCDQVDRDIEPIEADELLLRESVPKTEVLILEETVIREIWVESIDGERDTTNESSITHLCEEVKLALKLWDGAFSMIHKKEPSDTHCNNTQTQINLAMAQMHCIGLPISPKAHGMACHIVHHMRTFPGGVAMLLEYWVESYHQKAKRYDVYWRGMTAIQRQAEIRARLETTFRTPEVRSEKERIVAAFVGVRKRKRSTHNIEKAEKCKKARLGAVGEMIEKLDVCEMIEKLATAKSMAEMGKVVDESLV